MYVNDIHRSDWFFCCQLSAGRLPDVELRIYSKWYVFLLVVMFLYMILSPLEQLLALAASCAVRGFRWQITLVPESRLLSDL